MKNQILLLISVIIFITSCKKDDKDILEQNNDQTPTSPLGIIPEIFQQRVFIEELTGEWCQNCPSGKIILESIYDSSVYNHRIDIISAHNDDWLGILNYDTLRESFGQYYFGLPCSAIGRVKEANGDFWFNSTLWQNRVSARLTETHDVGIAIISEIMSDSGYAEIHIGHHSPLVQMRLSVFITEDNIPQHVQQNGWQGYLHNFVLRDIVSKTLGDTISSTENNENIMSYKFPLTGYNLSNVKIVAIVAKWGSYYSNDRKVQNSRTVKLGETAKWE